MAKHGVFFFTPLAIATMVSAINSNRIGRDVKTSFMVFKIAWEARNAQGVKTEALQT